MNQINIDQFEQESPVRMIAKLNRMNLTMLSGPLGEIGIMRGGLPFLMEVLRCEGVIQDDISKALSVDRAATARALLQLEKEGLVERREDPDDRRRKRVYPTEKACGLRDDLMVVLKNQRNALFRGFGEQEQAQCLAMLHRMVTNMFSALSS